jgi:excinuclease UvrABC ATPase subunit
MEGSITDIKTAIEIGSHLTGVLFIMVLPILEFHKLNQAVIEEQLSKLKDKEQ